MNAAKLISPAIESSFAAGFDWLVTLLNVIFLLTLSF